MARINIDSNILQCVQDSSLKMSQLYSALGRPGQTGSTTAYALDMQGEKRVFFVTNRHVVADDASDIRGFTVNEGSDKGVYTLVQNDSGYGFARFVEGFCKSDVNVGIDMPAVRPQEDLAFFEFVDPNASITETLNSRLSQSFREEYGHNALKNFSFKAVNFSSELYNHANHGTSVIAGFPLFNGGNQEIGIGDYSENGWDISIKAAISDITGDSNGQENIYTYGITRNGYSGSSQFDSESGALVGTTQGGSFGKGPSTGRVIDGKRVLAVLNAIQQTTDFTYPSSKEASCSPDNPRRRQSLNSSIDVMPGEMITLSDFEELDTLKPASTPDASERKMCSIIR